MERSRVLSGTRSRVLNGLHSCSECVPAHEKFWRSLGVPAAFYFAFYLRSSNVFPVRLLLSGTVINGRQQIMKMNIMLLLGKQICILYTLQNPFCISTCVCCLVHVSISQTFVFGFLFLDTPTGGYMSEDQCSDMSGDQPQSMQTGKLTHLNHIAAECCTLQTLGSYHFHWKMKWFALFRKWAVI